MMLKGSKRGGASDLGRHLLKPENEHVEIYEIRGFAADNVVDAFKEAEAISRGTRCQKFLFSLSLSPPEAERVPVKVFEDALGTIEAKLGLIGQPRILIFHEKAGRRHLHAVWSRIDAETMTAIDMPHFKMKLQDVSRKLYIDHGWKMPDGLIDPALRNPLNFDRQEWFQAKRTGQDPRAVKALFQQCWAASDSGKAFQQALQSRGYYLARGDRRGVVALDVHGEVYAVARWANVKTKEVTLRISDPDTLPSVASLQKQLADRVVEKLSGFIGSASTDFAQAAQALDAKRLAMVGRHRAERSDLQTRQEERWIREAKQRSERFRKGLRGLWDRLTGQHATLRRQNEQETTAAAERDKEERQLLIDRQLEERQRLQREIKQARHVHLHEVTQLHREMSANRKMKVRPEVGMADLQAKRHRRKARPELSGP